MRNKFAVILFALFVPAAFAQDVVLVNPNTAKLKLDNARARVIEAHLPPGAKEAMHSHPPSIIYVIDGGKVRNHLPDGTTAEAELKAGDVIYREPLTHWNENIGTTTIHLIVIELKPNAQP